MEGQRIHVAATMNPLIHINFRIWTLWTPDWWWSDWTPKSCSELIPLFTLPHTMKGIIFRACYLFGAVPWSWTTHISHNSHWEIDFGFDCKNWLDDQTS